MTELYQAMSYKLWLKYIAVNSIQERLKVIKENNNLVFAQDLNYATKNADGIAQLKSYQVDKMVKLEQIFLKYLTFKGLMENKVEFNDQELDEIALVLEVQYPKLFQYYLLTPRVLVISLKLSPFLNTQDDGPEEQRKYYF